MLCYQRFLEECVNDVNRLTFTETDDEKLITVEPHIIPNRGPYVYNQPKRWTVEFVTEIVSIIKYLLSVNSWSNLLLFFVLDVC